MLAPIRSQAVKSGAALGINRNAVATLRPVCPEAAAPVPLLSQWSVGSLAPVREVGSVGRVGFDDFAFAPVPIPDRVAPELERQAASHVLPEAIDPLYLFACRVEWERRSDPCSGWELISAAESSHEDTRANAKALLAASRHLAGGNPAALTAKAKYS